MIFHKGNLTLVHNTCLCTLSIPILLFYCYYFLITFYLPFNIQSLHLYTVKDWGLSQGIVLTMCKSLKHNTLVTACAMIFTHHCVSPAFTLWNRLYEIKSYVRSSTSLAAVLEVKGAEWGRRGQNCYVWVSDCGGGTFYNSLLNLIPFSSSFYLHATLHFEGESHKYGNYEAGWVTQEDVSLWVCQIFLHGGFRLGRCRIRPAVEALQLAALNFCWKWPLNHCFLLMPDDIRRNER